MKLTLLWISDSPHFPTGFGRTSGEILKRLSDVPDFDAHCLAIGGTPSLLHHEEGDYTVWHHPDPRPSKGSVMEIVRSVQPDVVVTLSNIWSAGYMEEITDETGVKWVGYFPVDAGPLPAYFASVLERMDARVTTSSFSADVFRRSYPHLDVRIIRHGVDAGIFRPGSPADGKPRLRNGDPAFVIGCVARNQPRKGLPTLVKAFSTFARSHPDAMLHLHTDPWDEEGWMLGELLSRHGVEDRTSFTQAMLRYESVDDEELRDIYRSFDVFALPTMGEGFGLPILEAMACGVPVAATEGIAVSEMVGGRGELIQIISTLTVPPHNFEAGLVDADKLASALERLYENPGLRSKYARLGRKYAEGLTWDKSAECWESLLRETVGKCYDEGNYGRESDWRKDRSVRLTRL